MPWRFGLSVGSGVVGGWHVYHGNTDSPFPIPQVHPCQSRILCLVFRRKLQNENPSGVIFVFRSTVKNRGDASVQECKIWRSVAKTTPATNMDVRTLIAFFKVAAKSTDCPYQANCKFQSRCWFKHTSFLYVHQPYATDQSNVNATSSFQSRTPLFCQPVHPAT